MGVTILTQDTVIAHKDSVIWAKDTTISFWVARLYSQIVYTEKVEQAQKNCTLLADTLLKENAVLQSDLKSVESSRKWWFGGGLLLGLLIGL